MGILKNVKMGVEPNREENVFILMHINFYIYKFTNLKSKCDSKQVVKGNAV